MLLRAGWQRRNLLPVDAVLLAEPFRLLGDFCFATATFSVFVFEHLLDAFLFGTFTLLALALFAFDEGLQAAGLSVDFGLLGG